MFSLENFFWPSSNNFPSLCGTQAVEVLYCSLKKFFVGGAVLFFFLFLAFPFDSHPWFMTGIGMGVGLPAASLGSDALVCWGILLNFYKCVSHSTLYWWFSVGRTRSAYITEMGRLVFFSPESWSSNTYHHINDRFCFYLFLGPGAGGSTPPRGRALSPQRH